MNDGETVRVLRKNLVILRAGDASLHRGWIAQPNRDFDLFISYYGKQPGLHQADADYYEHRPGPKWSCIAELLAERPELIERYEAFWFPDDDLSTTTEILNRMFALFHGFSLALAQPALTRDSYYSWSGLLQRSEYVMRHVDFVEVMAPLFDRVALRACLKTFSQSRSGWGLDWIWPTLVARGRNNAIAVLDATPVKHTRPLGGDLYRNNPELSPEADQAHLLTEYGQTLRAYTSQHRLHGVLQQRRPPLWERAILALRRIRAKRQYRRAIARTQSRGTGE